MRVAIVNPVWDPEVQSPARTLDRFTTLTGWVNAIKSAGAAVTVHQRFSTEAAIRREGTTYAFVFDGDRAAPGRMWRGTSAIAESVLAAEPDVVHVNGVVFPAWLRALRRRLPGRVCLVVQDHGGWHPARASRAARVLVRRGLSSTDALLVSSPGHVALWRRARAVPARVRVADVMESSVDMVPVDRDDARNRSGVVGDPAILWVGRLTTDKDPLTVLDGFTRFLTVAPNATLTWVFSEGAMEAVLRRTIQGDARLVSRVRIVGAVPHQDLAAYFSAADVYVSGSRVEGSGYAAMEAMACGATPVLTDIPSFRAMTDAGRTGALWAPGDARSLSDALARVAIGSREGLRRQVRARFQAACAWDVIGRRAVAIYQDVCAR